MVLNEKHRAFCYEYMLGNQNGTAAYKTVYRCSDSTARRNATRLLTNAHIQAFLAKLRSRIAERSEITLERTIQEIGRIAFSNVTDSITFDEKGVSLKNSDELPDDVTAAIARVEFKTTDGTTHIMLGLHNKIQALTLLANHFGICDDFNKALSTLQRYGLYLVPDESASVGWKVIGIGETEDSQAKADQAALEFFEEG